MDVDRLRLDRQQLDPIVQPENAPQPQERVALPPNPALISTFYSLLAIAYGTINFLLLMYKNQIYSSPTPKLWALLLRLLLGIPITIIYVIAVGRTTTALITRFRGDNDAEGSSWARWGKIPVMVYFGQQKFIMIFAFLLVAFTPDNWEDWKVLVDVLGDVKGLWTLWLYLGAWVAFTVFKLSPPRLQ
ncbi:hypothetical protein TWF694_001372 [Orbilia ellipsospora]|uniref:Uncharacterized protein n=1 Tax=Orbilia ellipsospora TaxID=2528407 RepID=A0AAV9XT99_9PEZI